VRRSRCSATTRSPERPRAAADARTPTGRRHVGMPTRRGFEAVYMM
jgi:hypothetical protein